MAEAKHIFFVRPTDTLLLRVIEDGKWTGVKSITVKEFVEDQHKSDLAYCEDFFLRGLSKASQLTFHNILNIVPCVRPVSEIFVRKIDEYGKLLAGETSITIAEHQDVLAKYNDFPVFLNNYQIFDIVDNAAQEDDGDKEMEIAVDNAKIPFLIHVAPLSEGCSNKLIVSEFLYPSRLGVDKTVVGYFIYTNYTGLVVNGLVVAAINENSTY